MGAYLRSALYGRTWSVWLTVGCFLALAAHFAIRHFVFRIEQDHTLRIEISRNRDDVVVDLYGNLPFEAAFCYAVDKEGDAGATQTHRGGWSKSRWRLFGYRYGAQVRIRLAMKGGDPYLDEPMIPEIARDKEGVRVQSILLIGQEGEGVFFPVNGSHRVLQTNGGTLTIVTRQD